MSTELTQERLRLLVTYDSGTGVISWNGIKNNQTSGRLAGSPDRHGYLQTRVDGKIYFNHRLAWLYVYGHFPICVIDHIDGNHLNNSINNLRDVSRRTNQENQRIAPLSNKTTGLLGATLHTKTGKFMAKIQVNRKQIYLGLFTTPEAAHAEYVKAKRELHIGVTI